MKDHAKASSAGSIAGRGHGLDSIRRAFATRGASTGASGSSTSSHRLVALVLMVAFIGLLALAPSALGADRGPSASIATGDFATGDPQALTVDQSNGDVYAIDTAAPTLSRYDASGNPKNFTAGPDAGTNTLTGIVFEGPGAAQVAIDNSGGPSDGNIYVTDAVAGVRIYSNAGAPLGILTGAGTPAGNYLLACGVAVDQTNGDLYVADFGQKIWRYTPSSGALTEADYSDGITTDGAYCPIAADSGKVYAAKWSFTGGQVKRHAASDFAPDGAPSPAGTDVAPNATTLATDPSTGELYVNEGNRISVYDSSGVQQYTFGSSAEFGSDSNGVAVKGAGGKAYVADRTNGEIDVYGLTSRANTSSFGTFATGDPQALTVDQSNGDVYAIDTAAPTLSRYDASGNPKNFTAGPDAGTNTLTGIVFEGPGAAQVAIDNSGGPSDGNIYVTDAVAGVRIYSNAGAPLGILTGAGTPAGNYLLACGVAVDQTNGDLYVADFGQKIWRYTPSSGALTEADYSDGITTDGAYCPIAADSGKVYAAKWSFTGGQVKRHAASDFAPDGAPSPAGTDVAPNATTLATDPSTGELYVNEGNRISVYDSSGVQQYTFGSSAEFGSDSNGVAVKGAGGKAYVADRTNGEIDVYSVVLRHYKTSFGTFATGDPQALTVDQSNGDVYAIDTAAPTLSRYDASGNPKNFTAGPDAGTNTLTGIVFEGPGAAQVAIDNSGGPSDGNIYVTDAVAGVRIYSNAGAPLGILTGAGTPAGNYLLACGVAVDQTNGDLYVADFGQKIWRYTPSSGALTEADYSDGITTDGAYCPIAADSGKVYAAKWSFTGGQVKRHAASDFAPDGAPSPAGTDVAPNATTLATDPSTGELYVNEGNRISVYDSSGVQQYTFGSSAEFGSDSNGVAVKGAGGKAYVADRTNGEIDVYGSFAGGASPPSVTTQPATGVGLGAATLNGVVNPRSGLVSDCHFEYVADAQFQVDQFASATTAPCAPAPGGGANAVSVSVDLTNLPTGTTYHFRVVATNPGGTTAGEAATFSTIGVAFTDPATGTDHHTNATLHGHIEPNGDTITNCQFDWGTTTSYGNTADCAEGDAFTDPATVSAFISNFTPGVTIHYRLHLSTAGSGEALGDDRRFKPLDTVIHDLTDTIGSPGSGAGQFSIDVKNPDKTFKSVGARGVAVDQQTGDIYVADSGNHRLVKLDPGGNFLWAVGNDVVASGPDNLPGPNEVQNVTVTATGGTFHLKFEKDSTSEVAFDASATAVQTALEGLPTLDPGDIQVTGANGGPWTIEFVGTRVGSGAQELFADGSKLTGPGKTADVTTIQQGGGAEICLPADTCKSGGWGNGPGEFATPSPIAIDNSGGPSEGDVYVLDRGYERGGGGQSTDLTVTKFNPSGNVIATWGTGGQLKSITRPSGLAVDSSGRLNVTSETTIQRRDATTGGLVDTLDGTLGLGSIALEPGGTILGLANSIMRFDPSLPPGIFTNNFHIGKSVPGGYSAASGITVDSLNGDLYASVGEEPGPSRISVYRFDDAGRVIQPDFSTCVPIKSLFGPQAGTEGCDPTLTFGLGDLTNASAIAVRDAARKVYVIDSGQLKIFAGTVVLPPTLRVQDPSALTGTSATFNGKVDPEGIEVSDCHFSYVEDAEFQINGFTNAAEVPCSSDPGSGSGDVPVSADVSGLDPATLYHFRLQAENATPRSTATSGERTFTSRGPIITNTHADPITATNAVLRAGLNAQGSPTTYHFDYGPTPSYGSSTPESVAIGGTIQQTVSEQIDGLTPGTTYHFRIVAQNPDATIAGPDVTFTTAAAADSCPNAALRTGHGFSLPDCRAYEQASQVDKGGAHALTTNGFASVAADGNGVTYAVTAGINTSGGGSTPAPVVARRTASGWITNGLIPLTEGEADLSGWDPNLATSHSTDATTGDFYVGDTAAGTWTSPFSGTNSGAGFKMETSAFADDPAHFLISSETAITDGAVEGKPNLYEYDHGSLSLVGRVPVFPATSCDDDDIPACVASANGAFSRVPNAISADGSQIVFTERETNRIYLREGAKTIQVSASQASSPDPNGHKFATLSAVSRDGGTIYFTSCEKLTDDSTAVSTAVNTCTTASQGSDLYSYDVGSGDLTDLTVESNPGDPRGADVQGVVGASSDGSHIYFSANGRLASGAPAGDCTFEPAGGECELYLIHNGGAPVDVATVAGTEVGLTANTGNTHDVADNGTLLLYSSRQLTAYDNTGSRCLQSNATEFSGPCTELYRYRPGDPAVTCISCNPSGTAPAGSVQTTPIEGAAAFILGTRSASVRSISADGNRVFFQTPDGLLARDVNGEGGCPRNNRSQFTCTDAYEWEANGTGSCHSADQNGGCLYLLSSGTSSDPAFIVGASTSGDDVFIRTTDRLVPQDKDDLYDVYDVRVGGGFASQHVASPPPCGGAEQCRGQGTAAPPASGAGTAAFEGPGNSAPEKTKRRCPKGKQKVRRAGKTRCVKRHSHKNKRSQKRANSNPGGSK